MKISYSKPGITEGIWSYRGSTKLQDNNNNGSNMLGKLGKLLGNKEIGKLVKRFRSVRALLLIGLLIFIGERRDPQLK